MKLIQDKVFVIAEAGVNHNGSIDTGIALIDVAAEAGADAVKFQTFKASNLLSREAKKAEYQLRNSGNAESQFEMIKRLELDEAAHHVLKSHCESRNILFLSTPFDSESLGLLVGKFNMPIIKIASGEITNAPLLLDISRTGRPIILSTGMSTLADIEQALSIIAFGYLQSDQTPSENGFRSAFISEAGQRLLFERVSLLHCTTEYPAPFNEVNLRAMQTLVSAFGLPVGLSDHTQGIAIAIAAVATGAKIVEKHFTLDRNMPGPDHKASLEPAELRSMIESIRQVEVAQGMHIKTVTASEIKNCVVARKSLVALCDIQKGDVFTTTNLGVKRPGGGISPVQYWNMLGRSASKDFTADEMIIL